MIQMQKYCHYPMTKGMSSTDIDVNIEADIHQ